MASVALSAKQERRTENVFNMLLISLISLCIPLVKIRFGHLSATKFTVEIEKF